MAAGGLCFAASPFVISGPQALGSQLLGAWGSGWISGLLGTDSRTKRGDMERC